MNCDYCNSRIIEEDENCSHCGAPIKDYYSTKEWISKLNIYNNLKDFKLGNEIHISSLSNSIEYFEKHS